MFLLAKGYHCRGQGDAEGHSFCFVLFLCYFLKTRFSIYCLILLHLRIRITPKNLSLSYCGQKFVKMFDSIIFIVYGIIL